MSVVDEMVELAYYRVDGQAHIRLREELCAQCTDYLCINVCPAGCYAAKETRPGVSFQYERCLECGTCRVVCAHNAIDWHYPRGGCGVTYRFA